MARQSENRAGGQIANDSGRSQSAPPADSGRILRIAALVAVAVGLAALTAGACVLSYEHIHHLAIQAGVTPQLARIYPLIFDALLVLAGCSVLALRGAGLPSRIYAWACVLAVVAMLAAGGALHAAGVIFSRKLAGVLAAVLPWALVLTGFGLLLVLLRYARLRRQDSHVPVTEHQAAPLPRESADAGPAGTPVGTPVVPAPRAAADAAEAPVRNPALAALAVARQQSEPATTPQLAATPAATAGQAQAGIPGHATAGTPGSVTPSPRAATEAGGTAVDASRAGADLAKPGEPARYKLPVRQADLQLRARIPRPGPTAGGPPPTTPASGAPTPTRPGSGGPSSGGPSSGGPSSGGPSSGGPTSNAPASGAPNPGARTSAARPPGEPAPGAPAPGASDSAAQSSPAGAAPAGARPASAPFMPPVGGQQQPAANQAAASQAQRQPAYHQQQHTDTSGHTDTAPQQAPAQQRPADQARPAPAQGAVPSPPSPPARSAPAASAQASQRTGPAIASGSPESMSPEAGNAELASAGGEPTPGSPVPAAPGSGLRAAPTEPQDEEDNQVGGLRAFLRLRSSPTPPDED